MTVDQSGTEIVTNTARAVYDHHDRQVDEYMAALLACMREVPFPKAHSLPVGTDRMRYAPLERDLLTAVSALQRGWQRWKEGRS